MKTTAADSSCGAQKTSRLVEQLRAAKWKRSLPYRRQRAMRVPLSTGRLGPGLPIYCLALREAGGGQSRGRDQYNINCSIHAGVDTYRVFVTNMVESVDLLVWLYNQRAAAENLIKEANNDAGLAAHPSTRWTMNCNHFQIAMLGLQPELLADAVQPGDQATAEQF